MGSIRSTADRLLYALSALYSKALLDGSQKAMGPSRLTKHGVCNGNHLRRSLMFLLVLSDEWAAGM